MQLLETCCVAVSAVLYKSFFFRFSDGGSPFEGPNVSGMLRSFLSDYVKGLAVLLCQMNAFNDGESFYFIFYFEY